MKSNENGITQSPILRRKDINDVETIDSIINALYESVSFSPGSQPDYDRFKKIFITDGRLVPPLQNDNASIEVLDLETFISRSMVNVQISELGRLGFYEKEIFRITETYGNIAHVFSAYEARYAKNDSDILARGINSVQLICSGKRWWVLNIFWINESTDRPIPNKYLPVKHS